MKTLSKRIITAILCAVIAITGIGSSTAYAAGKKLPLKVTFNGTSVNLLKDMKKDDYASEKVETIEKKWGKPSKKEAVDDAYIEYTWKKGKTTIGFTLNTEHNSLFMYHIDIKDKNGALCGLKVGMKKEMVLKKMQKMFGKKNVIVVKEGQGLSYEDDGKPVPLGEPTGDGDFVWVNIDGYPSITVLLKNGKVSSIGF